MLNCQFTCSSLAPSCHLTAVNDVHSLLYLHLLLLHRLRPFSVYRNTDKVFVK